MPTGYTDIIKPGTSLETFILRCARAFGATVEMRDHPMDATIPEFKPSDYHKAAAETARKTSPRIHPGFEADAVSARPPKAHVLKCSTIVFPDVVAGIKDFEWRRYDRDFRVGDTLELREVRPGAMGGPMETGQKCHRKIKYVLQGGLFDMPAGFVILGLEPTRW